MSTLVIVQARMGSRRLPGKALADIGGKPVLEHVIDRARQANIGDVILATTTLDEEKPLIEVALGLRVPVYAGDVDDVLGRFYRAWSCLRPKASTIVRVTADCPFLDPLLLRHVAHAVEGFDYCGVTGAPDGWHQEAFTVSALLRAHAFATDPADREHVVPYMVRNFRCGWVQADISGPRLTLDTPADLKRLRRMAA